MEPGERWEYMALPPAGLEIFCEEELKEVCKDFRKISEGRGYIRFESSSEGLFLIGQGGLKSVDRLLGFLYEGKIGLQKDQLEHLEVLPSSLNWESGLSSWKNMFPEKVKLLEEKGATFRVTVDRYGKDQYKHQFSSQEASVEIGAGVINHMGWKAKMIGYDLEVFGHIRNEGLVIGITLCHYHPEIRHKDAVLSKRNRVECSLTTLNSAIAYCMCKAAKIQPGNVVLDPMVGSGIIPIEGSLSHPQAHFIASDISEEELKIAQKNIQNIQELHISITQASVTKLPFPSHSIDRIISDLPFGRRHLNATKNQALYPKMLSEFIRITKPTSRIVLLTLERGLMKKILPLHTELTLLDHFTIDVGGLDAELYILLNSTTPNT